MVLGLRTWYLKVWGLGMLNPLNWTLERLQKQGLCDLLPPVSCPQSSSSRMTHRNQSCSSPRRVFETRAPRSCSWPQNQKASPVSFFPFSLEDIHYRRSQSSVEEKWCYKNDYNITQRTIGNKEKLGPRRRPSVGKSILIGCSLPNDRPWNHTYE